MTPEKIDYLAILADMKAKRQALEASIAALEAAMASGTLGAPLEGSSGTASPSAPPNHGQPMDLPSGAFLGKSIPDSVKLYLAAMRKRKTVKEIATALQDGGMVSTSGEFESVVRACLQRLRGMGQVLKFADGWGLAEWYPAGFRASAEKTTKPNHHKVKGRAKVAPKTKAAPKKREKAVEPKEPAQGPIQQTGGEQSRIEGYFAQHPGQDFTVGDLTPVLGIRVQTIALVCAKLAHAGKLERVGEKRFRLAKVAAMPKAV